MTSKVVILDFDGVILDSVNIKTEAFKEIFNRESKVIQNKIVNYHLKNGGISREKKFEYFYKNYFKKKLSKNTKLLLSKKFNKIVFKKILKCNYISGAYKFIDKNKTYKLFISSGTPQKELRLICKKRKIYSFFKQIYGSPKSKENHIKEIKKKFRKNDLFIFIGDSLNDFDASKKTKINFIQVGNNIKKKIRFKRKIRNLLKLDKVLESL